VECTADDTTGPARQGKLPGLATGRGEVVACAKPILNRICRWADHVGAAAAAASMKLAINLHLPVLDQAFGEALSRHPGRDPDRMAEFFAKTASGRAVLKSRGAAIVWRDRTYFGSLCSGAWSELDGVRQAVAKAGPRHLEPACPERGILVAIRESSRIRVAQRASAAFARLTPPNRDRA
jgi:3-hydroxyisobutyrate dehydrogenase-like beta-hydroxyacid dehydrogenase